MDFELGAFIAPLISPVEPGVTGDRSQDIGRDEMTYRADPARYDSMQYRRSDEIVGATIV